MNPVYASLVMAIVSAATGLVYYSQPAFGRLTASRLKLMMGHQKGYLDDSLNPRRLRRVAVMTFVFMFLAALAYSALAEGYGLLFGASPWQLAFSLWIFFGAAFRVITYHFKFDRILILVHVAFWTIILFEYALLFPMLMG